MRKLLNMIKIELKISWKSLVVSSLGISILALIPIMIAKDINVNKGSVLTDTITLLSPTITQIYMYTVILRLRSVIRDKSTLDKNRAAFLTHNKATVIFSKVFIDIFSFMLPMIITMGIAMPSVLHKNGMIDAEYTEKLIVLLFGITFVYICTSLGMRYIDTIHTSTLKKSLIMGGWVLATLAVTIVGAIVVGILGHQKRDGLTNPISIHEWLINNGITSVPIESDTAISISPEDMKAHNIASYGSQYIIDPKTHVGKFHLTNIIVANHQIFTSSSMGIQNFFKNNQILVSILPFLNFITPFLPFYRLMDAWTVLPLMLEITIFVIVLWRPLTRKLKTHLTT